MVSSEHISAASSIGIQGMSAVGKEQSADVFARLLGKTVVNTGKSIRGITVMAHIFGLFEEGRGNAVRLRPEADMRILDWTLSGKRGLHFEPRTPDVSAHIFFGEKDLTRSIRPRKESFTAQSVLEPAAALIATNGVIRPGLLDLWHRTAIEFGGPVMITKNIEAYLPEAHAIFHLFVTDAHVSAQYRMRRGIAATNTLSSEVAYLRARDRLHADYGLEDISKRAIKIDMTPLLLQRGGFQKAAQMMVEDLREIRR